MAADSFAVTADDMRRQTYWTYSELCLPLRR